MGAFFVYILKTAVCLSAFYLFYRLLLSRETFHRFNRIAVLGILLISLLIPFCEVKVAEQTEVHQTVLSLEQLLLLADMMEESPTVQAQGEKTIWVPVILYIYLVGILFFTCRNIYSLIRLSLLLKSGEKEKLEGKITLIVHDKNDLAPFSWMKFIVISRKDLEENGREILIHELAHIRKRHSVDLLMADICIFFQWFNPAAWLLKQELQTIHEYEADETVIKEGIDAKQYQLLLIKKAVGTRLYSMANSFNHSKLKKRITMMLKEKSSPWARLKYLYVLPLAAIAVTAFARPEVSNELNEISKVKVNDLTAITETTVVENTSLRNDSMMFIRSKPTGTTSEKKKPPHIEVVGYRELSVSDTTTMAPLFFVDGKEVNPSIMSAIKTECIKSISVLKDSVSTKAYGDRGKYGVVIITLKDMKEIAKTSSPTGNLVGDIKKIHASGNPIVMLDGKEIESIDSVDPSTIKVLKVIKESTRATEEEKLLFTKFGDRSKNGFILITSKKPGDKSDIQLLTAPGNDVVTVDGLVTDESGEPVVGATIVVSGTNTGTVSGLDGKFLIKAPTIAMLNISYVGMETSTVKAAKNMVVKLKAE